MKVTTIMIAMFLAFQLQAQDPFLQKNDRTIEQFAQKITKTYNKQLALNGEQPLLFQKKVEEFLIREKKIRTNFKGTEMLNLIYKLRITETGEMANILTRPQFNLYKKIKPEIQPLDITESENFQGEGK
ncbi:hypothetical protein [Tamlana flava]|uniref:hypothetical protein n=1 Tax=Tamlana flava TaxID=3158572 RepID=UPI00351AF0A8